MNEPKWTPGPWRLRQAIMVGNTIEAPTGRRAHDHDDGYRIVASYQDACDSNLVADQEANLHSPSAALSGSTILTMTYFSRLLLASV